MLNKNNALFRRFKRHATGLLFAATLVHAGASQAINIITGAGATFPYPVYAKWAETYAARTGGVVNYLPVGSSNGIRQVAEKLVDFGASDMPLTAIKLEKEGLMQFPAVIGGVTPVVNIEGIAAGKLKLDGTTLANIYLGKITKWNDPAVVALNKDLKLPDAAITPVYRSDGSGTTFIFTNYLSKACDDWKASVGDGFMIPWRVGISGKGNDGVAASVHEVKNSIGYVEYAYARQHKMAYVQMKNRDGQFVLPGTASFKAAAENASWESSSSFRETLTDQAGRESWPISGASFILMHKVQKNAETGRAILKFFKWAHANGGKQAADLGYAPLTDRMQNLTRKAWRNETRDTRDLLLIE